MTQRLHDGDGGEAIVSKSHTGHVKLNDTCAYWLVDGELHRDDGPAVLRNGYEAWYRNGDFHRDDGPAVKLTNGTTEYWLFGRELDPIAFEMYYLLVNREEYIRETSE